MKKLLFVTSALGYGVGGSEKALIEMLQRLDTTKYDITVLSLNEKTEKPFESENINVQYGYPSYLYACTPMREIIRKPFYYPPTFAALKLKVALFSRFSKTQDSSGVYWDWYNQYVAPVDEEYDVVIGYGPGTATYFAVDKVKAKRTVLWVDTDLRGAHFNTDYMRRFYEKADCVVTVDQSGVRRFADIYPTFAGKALTIRNIIPVEEIRHKATQDTGFDDDYSGIRLLSVGRLCEAKAFHLAVDAAAILRDQGYKFRWYIIGFGPLEAPLREQIMRLHLEDQFFLLGQKLNPYPYYAQTDLYVQTSVYEGSPLTIEEALALGKPIITTNIPAAYEIIKNGENGIITEMTPEAIAGGIAPMLRNEQMRKDMSDYIRSNPLDYMRPILAFDEMIEKLQLE